MKADKNSHIRYQWMLMLLLLISVNVTAAVWNESSKVVASVRALNDQFGYSVAISGDYAIVGAMKEDHNETDGAITTTDAGSAYIFKNNNGAWTRIQKIVASDRQTSDQFGYSVAISGDYAVLGARYEDHDATGGDAASNSGSAYVFKNIGGVWTQMQKIVASVRGSDDWFGYAVSISGDYIIVGAYGDDQDAVEGAVLSRAGSAYVFRRSAETWTQVNKLVASDREYDDKFGSAVAISGDYAIVGAHDEDHNFDDDVFRAASGSVYLFANHSDEWNQVKKVTALDRDSGDHFGYSVAIAGDYAVVGAYQEDEDVAGVDQKLGAGSAYILKRSTIGVWEEIQKVVASDREINDEFGHAVAISGNYAIVGAHFEDEDANGNNSLDASGSAYIFKNSNGTWIQIQKSAASTRANTDNFGYSVAISQNNMIIGAHLEDEDTNEGNTLADSGSAYIFSNKALVNPSLMIYLLD